MARACRKAAVAAILALAVACGRIGFDDLSDGGCASVCPAGTIRCLGGSQQSCADVDLDGCLEWGFEVPCSSGECLDAAGCTYSGTCREAPLAVMPSFIAPGGSVCEAGDPASLPWKLVELTPGEPLTIDGVDVVACVMLDYGQTCAPRQICASGTGDELLCGDDCGGTPCTACGASDPLVASFWLFAGATPEITRFRQAGVVQVQASPNVSGSCFGITPFETRYVLACRPACGASAWNVAVGAFQLVN